MLLLLPVLHGYRRIGKRISGWISLKPMNHYLLEIGTEELPAGFLATAPAELSEKVKTMLHEAQLAYTMVQVLATPRRLTLQVSGLPDEQSARTEKVKGPPTRIALDEQGNPTPAGLGFTKKIGVDFAALKQETLDGETYLVYEHPISGRPTGQILAETLPELILSLSGSHFMRWADLEVRFSRPIRWLASLWNQEVLPLTIENISADRLSRGHRVMADGPLSIPSSEAYVDILESQGHVVVDPARRRERIWEQLQAAAKKQKGVVAENPDLLETVTMLVESPSVVVGNFDKKFLALPKPVITTVMSAHQKYFPVEDAKTGKLLPYFLTVSNGRPEAAETIRLGNEKVITARFEDARFFFEEDQKRPLADRLADLKGITFQKGLGSLYDKTQRLEQLIPVVSKMLGLSAAEQKKAVRAAQLSKCDLVTGMVRELTELQGEMGAHYAQLQGEDPAVCEALLAQYLPRFTGDALPKAPVSIVLSLADKADTLVAVFCQEKAKFPTGSKDPLGLRRLALGMILTVLENNLSLDLEALFAAAYQGLKDYAQADWPTTLDRCQTFLLQRLRGVLLDRQIRYDMIDAVLESGSPLANLHGAVQRMALLRALSLKEPDRLKHLYEPANRVDKILGTHYDPQVQGSDIEESLFEKPTEHALFKAVSSCCDFSVSEAESSLSGLLSLAQAVEPFFNEVMVNAEDEKVRRNRLRLLSLVHRAFLRVARFSVLVMSEASS